MDRVFLRVLIAATLLSAAAADALFRMGPVQVQTTPDRAGWNYALGEKAVFDIKVLKNRKPLPNDKLHWGAGPELLPPIRTGTADLSPEGTAHIDAGTRSDPGFLQLKVAVTDDRPLLLGIQR